MGLLDDNYTGNSLLDLGMGLLAASGPSRMPVSLGQVLANGYNHMQIAGKQRSDLQMEQEKFEMLKQYKQLEEQKLQADMEQQAQDNLLRQRMMGAFGGLLGGQAAKAQPVDLPALGEAQGSGPYRLNVETPQARANLSRQLDYLAKNDPQAHRQVVAALVKQGAIPQPMQPVPETDWGDVAKLSAMGQLAGVKGASGMMELAKYNKPDWQQVDSGGQIQFVNKNGNQMPVIAKSMSPDALAANQVAWANNEISRQNADIARFNAQKPTYHDGALVSPTGEIVKTPMYVPPKNSPEYQAQSSAKVIPLLEAADKLLNSSTGSYAGAGVDLAARTLGFSTTGAQAAAQLKALEGAIMMAQPRMEGPQSDKDVALYRQMAGQIGDSTIPVETRRAALKGIRAMHEKYSGGPPAGLSNKSTMSPGGWSATIVE